VKVVDLLELGLPFLDEPNHPRLRQYTQQHTRDWSARVDAADAFAFVTPEYNFSLPPALINALDFVYHEWHYKPVGFVSYGAASGGVRSVEHLKHVVTSLRMFPLYEAVAIPFVAQFLDDEGDLQPDERMERSAGAVLDELVRVEAAMRPLRAAVS